MTTNGNVTFTYCGGTAPTDIRNVVFADDVTSISYSAFDSCQFLTAVSIPSHITCIENNAFVGCRSLESITLPASITKIGFDAFAYCRNLNAIAMPPNVTSIVFGTFCYCTSLATIEIPPSVTYIGDGAFHQCEALTNIILPPSVMTIGADVFYNCESLTSITLSPNTPYLAVIERESEYDPPLQINENIGTIVDAINNQLRPSKNEFLYSKNIISSVFIHGLGLQYNDCKFQENKTKRILALYVNWDQLANDTNRSPLFVAAEANIGMSQGLNSILQGDGAAIENTDPVTGMEAFMLAAIGSNSKLESIYVLLENHPGVIIPHVGV